MLGPYYVNNEARRFEAWGPPCQIPWGSVVLQGKSYKIHRDTVPAFEALEKVRVKHGYVATGSDTGFYNCRHQRHDPNRPWSEHAWATALDWNWLQNPAGSKLVTDMPRPMIEELQALRTKSGAYVFQWGGDWDRDGSSSDHTYVDAMHWGVIAHPKDLATGIVFDGKLIEREDTKVDGLKSGDRGNAVKALQFALQVWRPTLNMVKDGIYGTQTVAGVRAYQEAANLPATGEADDTTLLFLLTNALRDKNTMANLIEGA